jgi:carbamoyltransferase
MDLAASIQSVTEEVVLRLTSALAKETGAERLCLAGGVALNCVANGKVLRAGPFRDIWVQPAAGDAGGAVGAALAAYHLYRGQDRAPLDGLDGMSGASLGPAFSQAEIERRLSAMGAVFTTLPSEAGLIEATVDALDEQKAVGWFQGRMEFGPRALGSRSILADARNPANKDVVNLKIKFRESFRPFAPSVLREDVKDWFELDGDSPYMLLVADVVGHRRRPMSAAEQALFGIETLNVPRSDIPAVTHVDYSARIQTVHADTNPRYHALLARFKALTGCPVLVNTSFNVRGEPIVCTPQDSYRCFRRTEMDALVLENFILRKEDQPAFEETADWRKEFELD